MATASDGSAAKGASLSLPGTQMRARPCSGAVSRFAEGIRAGKTVRRKLDRQPARKQPAGVPRDEWIGC
jgi:hypothetical protein